MGIASLGVLVYLTGESFLHLHRQELILKHLNEALAGHPQVPPAMEVSSQELFEEFMTTFRRALYEFTHGGVSFEDSGNMIFQ